jgi:hypothetical protein
VLQGDGAHGAELDAEQVDRRADRQAAQRLVEHHAHAHRLAVGRRQRGLAGVEQLEALALVGRRRGGRPLRRGKSHASGHDRGNGLRIDGQTAGVEGKLDAAGVPEARLRRHQRLVGGLDEDLHVERVARRVELVVDHATHARAPVVHRRADLQRTQILGTEDEAAPGLAVERERRRLQADELASRHLGHPRIDIDVGARQQRAQAADAGGADARTHDPEARVFDRQFGHALVQRGRHAHALAVVAERHLRHAAHHDFLVAQFAAPGLQAFGGAQFNDDVGTGLQQRAQHQVGTDQQGADRHQPDQREPQRIARRDQRLGIGRRRRVGRRHGVIKAGRFSHRGLPVAR